jgi:penicillin-binding protein 1C
MLSAGAAFIIRDLLESGGPLGRAVESGAGIRRGIAWKTGTSFGFRDAWSVGVSDRYTIGVWVGRPDGTPNPGFFGANIAAPLLVDLFNALDAGPPTAPPPTVRQERICWPLGSRAAGRRSAMSPSRLAWILNDAAPPTFPDRLRGQARYEIQVDAKTGRRARADCHSGALKHRNRPLAGRSRTVAGRRTASAGLSAEWAADCSQYARPDGGLKIVGAADGDILRRPTGADAPATSGSARPGGEVVWLVNGRPSTRRAASAGFDQRFVQPGRYDITVLDDFGHYDRVSLSVR